ncbi:MAG: hypothetical protein AAF490_31520 [Chloroflexota bacterium]
MTSQKTGIETLVENTIYMLPPDLTDSEIDFLNLFSVEHVVQTLSKILHQSEDRIHRSRAFYSQDSYIRYHDIESLAQIGDIACLPTLKQVVQFDDGVDYEGRSIKVLAKEVVDNLS